ncbi:MAG: RimJ/RimL family protein N-acetyltransferase [Gammaproteobacteria bacterium]|jgi:RimJ/RimL family protein N-acetyltransferase
MSRWIEPVVLTGTHVLLEPLSPEHAAGLAEAVRDGELWHLWYTAIPAPHAVDDYLSVALNMREHNGAMPFVVRDRRSLDIVGCTRFFNVDEPNRRLEIGHTWYAKRAQRTAVNSESKLLLLQHAFDQLDAIAVEFRTHWHNQASRKAIARLGAKQDGVLRHHQRGIDGTFRDTVVFSIIAVEWPAVRQSLQFALSRNQHSPT